jgi:LmbE family N-acetylglucosaminyl deacetylase
MSLLDRLLSRETPLRTLLAVSHPDDETIGAGILLSRLPDAWVLHLTDGAPRDPRFFHGGFAGTREEYERTRRLELTAAMALAGVAPQRLLRIEGVADQEAVHHLPRITREIAVLLRQLRPDVVITHAYEGGHPDHDAAAFAVRAAVELLRRGRSQPPRPPDIVEMPLYFARPGGGEPVFQKLLSPADNAMILELSPEERDLKERMLDCFGSQRDLLTMFRPPVREVFRPAPHCDFSRPPHAGRLQYEIWDFPIDGARWRDLARDAVEELEMPGWRG